MNLLATLIIYLTLLLGPLITMLSNNLFLMWIGLEMSLLAIIPLMTSKHHPRSTEAASKYFTTQATASMIFLLSILINFKQLGLWVLQPQTSYMVNLMILISLAIKLGLAPFHAWLPEVTQGIQPNTGMILLTWQKMAPMSILYQTYNHLNPYIMMTLATISVFIGAWNGLNQTQLRKMLAYSSIAHMGWMVAICPFNPNLMMLNLIIYILLTAPMFLFIKLYLMTSINSLSLTWNKMPVLLPVISTIMLSMGGLPPLTGFIPKWLIIYDLLKNNCTALALIMSMVALINLFFYTRIIYLTSLTTLPTNNNSKMLLMHSTKKINVLMPILVVMSTFILPLTPMLQN